MPRGSEVLVYYGDEKRLSMARSILPSKSRERAAVFKQYAHARARAACRAELRKALDLDYDFDQSFEGTRARDIRFMVSDRRGADKVEPFQKWAVAVTKDTPRESRLSAIRAVLPKNLIGSHALGHIEYLEHFETPAECVLREIRQASWRKPAVPRRDDAFRTEALHEIVLDNKAHRLFHRWMIRRHEMVEWVFEKNETVMQIDTFGKTIPKNVKRTYTERVGPTRPPLLGGLGDIGNYLSLLRAATRAKAVPCEPYIVRSIYNRSWGSRPSSIINESIHHTRRNPENHPEWWNAMNAFLDLWVEADRSFDKIDPKVLKMLR